MKRIWHWLFGHPPAALVGGQSSRGVTVYFCSCGAVVREQEARQ